MAPSKVADPNIMLAQKTTQVKPVVAGKMATRNSTRTSVTANMLKKMNLKDLSKRKADQLSPPKGKTTKRSAFYDITNAATGISNTNAANVMQKKTTTVVAKKATAKITVTAQPQVPAVTKIMKPTLRSTGNDENIDPKSKPVNALLKKVKEIEARVKEEIVTKKEVLTTRETRSKSKQDTKEKEIIKIVEETKTEILTTTKSSDEESLYVSALETISTDESLLIITPIKKDKQSKTRTPSPPIGVVDFDKEGINDPLQVSAYAMDIFKYLKTREDKFKVGDYMPKQSLINTWMRSLLVDWMVDVQEHFELNHETLYLAVKVMDLYLGQNKKPVPKESLQLIGAASLFIASKYDERSPPLIDDYLLVCENIYTRNELILMEIELFKKMDFCLGMPLSYRFLRRYARCCKTTMPVLTLARYILELSLMEYSMVFESESKIAAAALYLALRMKDDNWSTTLEYYSGYKLPEFVDLSKQLNGMLHRKPKESLRTVRNKYSHSLFFEVAKTPLIEDSSL